MCTYFAAGIIDATGRAETAASVFPHFTIGFPNTVSLRPKEEKRFKVHDINYSLQIMVVCELWLNHQPFEPDMKTGVMTSYELNKQIEFPIRICDLTQNTHIGFTVYDLSRPYD